MKHFITYQLDSSPKVLILGPTLHHFNVHQEEKDTGTWNLKSLLLLDLQTRLQWRPSSRPKNYPVQWIVNNNGIVCIYYPNPTQPARAVNLLKSRRWKHNRLQYLSKTFIPWYATVATGSSLLQSSKNDSSEHQKSSMPYAESIMYTLKFSWKRIRRKDTFASFALDDFCFQDSFDNECGR